MHVLQNLLDIGTFTGVLIQIFSVGIFIVLSHNQRRRQKLPVLHYDGIIDAESRAKVGCVNGCKNTGLVAVQRELGLGSKLARSVDGWHS
jgi:hypothetical protein